MRHFMLCRRTFIATLAILTLTVLGIVRSFDVSMAIMGVAVGLAGSNAWQERARHKSENKTTYAEK